jgi:hypothetical protein
MLFYLFTYLFTVYLTIMPEVQSIQSRKIGMIVKNKLERKWQSGRMRWAGHVARMGQKRKAYRILLESQKERDH